MKCDLCNNEAVWKILPKYKDFSKEHLCRDCAKIALKELRLHSLDDDYSTNDFYDYMPGNTYTSGEVAFISNNEMLTSKFK